MPTGPSRSPGPVLRRSPEAPGRGAAAVSSCPRARRPPPDSVTALVVGVCGLLGLLVGVLVNRAAGRFPWSSGEGGAGPAVRPPLVELGTALLFALTAARFGLSWELPAFLFLAGVGMLLAVVDARHKTLPNRVTLPSIGIGAALL